MAPEVWTQQKYSQMADMFSLGIVMWEIWYGKDVSTKYADPTYAQDLPRFRRQPFIEGLEEPDDIWKDIMTHCWKNETKLRPTAKDCIDKLEPLVLGKDD